MVIGTYFCFEGRNDFLFGDEFHSLANVDKSFTEIWTTFDRLGSGIALPVLQHGAMKLFGSTLFAYRLPAMCGALLSLIILYPTACLLVGRSAAALTVLLFSLNSMQIFYSGFGRAYSLMIFFSLASVYSFLQCLRQGKHPLFWLNSLIITSGLLPFIHLSALGFMIPVGCMYLVVSYREKRSISYTLKIGFCMFFAALLCFILYLPAWKPLWVFIHMKSGHGDYSLFSFMDVLTLLSGSRAAALVWIVVIPMTCFWKLKKKEPYTLLFVVSIFAPLLAIIVTRPHGMAYAYGRYVLTILPFCLMALAWFLVRLIHSLPGYQENIERISIFAGVLCASVLFLVSPLGHRHLDAGPFGNTYISMMPLPAFDTPWDGTPPFYSELARLSEEVQIIEAPNLFDRSIQLYRNYYLQHRRNTAIGYLGIKKIPYPDKQYVNLGDRKSLKKSGARFLVLHHKIKDEVDAYWDFVYSQAWPNQQDSHVASLMERQKRYFVPYMDLSDQIGYLTDNIGKPIYSDDWILVWDLYNDKE